MPIVGAFSVDGGKHSSRQNRPLPSRPNTEKFSASRQPRKTLAVTGRSIFLRTGGFIEIAIVLISNVRQI